MAGRDWIIIIAGASANAFAAYGKTTGPQNHTTPDRYRKARGWKTKKEATDHRDRWFPLGKLGRRGLDPARSPGPSSCVHCQTERGLECVPGCLARLARERVARDQARGF